MTTLRLVALTFAASLVLPGVASADGPRERSSSLSWVRLEGAESCLGGAALARAVEERLGRPVFVSAARGELVVEGRAERTTAPAGFRAVVTLAQGDGVVLGERVVDSAGASCDELGRLVAVAIAVMIDPLLPPAPPPPPPPPTRVVVRTRRVVVTRPARRWGLGADGSLAAAAGLLPGAALGVQGGFLLAPPRFPPLLAEGALLYARTDLVDLVQAYGGIALCPLTWNGRRLSLWGCAGVDVGGLFAAGRQPALVDAERLVAQAQVSLRAGLRLVGPLVLRAGLHLLVPLRHDELTTTDGTGRVVLYAPDPVAGVVALGLGLRFGP